MTSTLATSRFLQPSWGWKVAKYTTVFCVLQVQFEDSIVSGKIVSRKNEQQKTWKLLCWYTYRGQQPVAQSRMLME
jgi:hypothetical protein